MRKILLASTMLCALALAAPAGAQPRDDHHRGGHGGGRPATAAPANAAPTQLFRPGSAWRGRTTMAPAGGGIREERNQRGDQIGRGSEKGHGGSPLSTMSRGGVREDRDQHGRDRGGKEGHGGSPMSTTGRNGHGGAGMAPMTGRAGWGRSDHHDWSRYHRTVQSRHRYHWGSYRRPPGYYYRRWSVGAFLPALFFAQQYWIDSYYDFGLPPPPPGTRWVRYGDDALLVDDFSGEIVQVVYGVFY